MSAFTCRTTVRCRLMPLVVISSSSHLPLLSLWMRTIVVIQLFDSWTVFAWSLDLLHHKVFLSSHGTVVSAGEKEPEHACTSTPWCFVHVSGSERAVHVSVSVRRLKMRWWTVTDIQFAHLPSVRGSRTTWTHLLRLHRGCFMPPENLPRFYWFGSAQYGENTSR